MNKKVLIPIIAILVIVIVGIIIYTFTNSNNNKQTNNSAETNITNNEENNNIANESNQNENTTEISRERRENIGMKIKIDNNEYEIELDNNETTKEIVSNLPLNLKIMKYANHEYYSELPFTPTSDASKTSKMEVGHVYYFQGWNSFVINYEEADITPYQVVHIGEIEDKSIIELLKNANDSIEIEVIL